MTQLWRRLLFATSILSLLSPLTLFSKAQNITDLNGPVGSCPYEEVFLNEFAIKLIPEGSTQAIDIFPLLTPPYSPQGPNWRYVVERGADLPTGTISVTPLNITKFSTFRVRFNFGDYIFVNEGQEATGPLVAGTDFIELDVIQAPCEGTDIQEYSITLYQNGSSIITPTSPGVVSSTAEATPPPVVSSTAEVVPPPVVSSTAEVVPPTVVSSTAEVVAPEVSSTAPQSGGAENNPPPATEESSTGVVGTCPFTQVFLNDFSLFVTPTGSSVQVDLKPFITPTFSPSGPEFFYVIERGSDLPTGTLTFAPISFTAGSTFRVRFNHGDYVFLAEGQSTSAPLVAGTDLIEFDVIQPPCAGTDIQEYSITLYQNGSSLVPTSGGSESNPTPPVISPVSSSTGPAEGESETPTPPPVQPATGGSESTTPPASSQPVQCQAITFQQNVTVTGAEQLQVAFTNTATDRTVAWVDFHVSINAQLVAGGDSVDAPQFNFRMQAASANIFVTTLDFPVGGISVPLESVSYLNYFFTYCSELTDCNTEVFSFQPGAPPSNSSSEVTTPPPTGAEEGTTPSPTSNPVCPFLNFTQSVTANATAENTISFSWFSTTPDAQVVWVDLHVTVSSSTVNGQFNYRMFQTAVNATQTNGFVPTELFFYTFPGADGVVIPNDASVTYFFTYCVMADPQIDCNTQTFTFTRNPNQGGAVIGQPAPGTSGGGVCPAIEFTPSFSRSAANNNVLTVNFTVTTPNATIGWVDLHVSINSAMVPDGLGAWSPQFNYRMTQVNSTVFTYTFPGIDGVSVPATSYISYFFTYCSVGENGVMTDCNTDPGTFGASSAVQAAQGVSLVAIDNGNGGNSVDAYQSGAERSASASTSFVVAAAAVVAGLVVMAA